MDNNIKFSRRLIKGKIAEMIFERMFTESGHFTILRSGYEYSLPELAQYTQLPEVEKYFENIRTTPDFILISNDRKRAFIVEVKYRSCIEDNDILEKVTKILKIWNPSWLFVASPDGFFFEPCNSVRNKGGKIARLPYRWISSSLQEKYLKLLCEFEK